MIIDAIMSFFILPIKLLVQALPTINVSIPDNIMASIFEFFKMVGYFLPMKTIAVILGIKLSMWIFRITMAIIVRAKSFIPTMGS